MYSRIEKEHPFTTSMYICKLQPPKSKFLPTEQWVQSEISCGACVSWWMLGPGNLPVVPTKPFKAWSLGIQTARIQYV